MINVEIGTLDKRVELLRIEPYEDSTVGVLHQRYESICTTWARIEPNRGNTLLQDYKDTLTDLLKITIRYRPGIDSTMAVRYQDHIYAIRYVVDPYMAHVKLELVCEAKTMGDKYGYR